MAEKKKSAIIMQLRPKLQELRQYNLPEDKFKEFLLIFARILVPKWPEESLRSIINDLVK